MRVVKASQFEKDYQYQAAKKAARRQDVGRRTGRRGTKAWGQWNEAE